jgi:hypothetical protein
MLGIILSGAILLGSGGEPQLVATRQGASTVLSIEGHAFHQTAQQVLHPRLIEVPGSTTRLALWQEAAGRAGATPHYAIFLGEREPARVTPTTYDLKLRYSEFDPQTTVPEVAPELRAEPGNQVYIVQFETQPLEEFRQAIRAAGGTITYFLAHHSYLVRMNDQAKAAVEALPYVRWVGPYQPAYRLEEYVREGLLASTLQTLRYNIQVYEYGLAQKEVVAQRINLLGGTIHQLEPEGYTLQATLSPVQLRQIVQMNEVFFIDRWSPWEPDMDIARQIGGANYVQGLGNFLGQGITAGIRDTGVRQTHVDFTGRLTVRRNSSSTSHGTSVTGIVIGSGAANPAGRGMMPMALGVFTEGLAMTGTARYNETAALLQAPYFAFFETASGGTATTTQYTTDSFTIDDILFRNNILLLNSQSNTGNQNSRPQAWAKNVVSGGGTKHQNTLTKADDNWTGGASIGPAADGRIKPDLTHFYDNIFTTSSGSDTSYTSTFGGTSGATPIVAGHFGLLFQIWGEGYLGQSMLGANHFENRPSHSAIRALMYNQAAPYPFSSPTADLSRVKQGWGMPDLKNVFDRRHRTFVSDQEFPLQNLQKRTFRFFVPAGETDFRATMIYLEPPGTTTSTLHRINDLTLKVTAPNGTVYFGNNGLMAGIWSTPGGSPNTIDNVENVFVQNPQAGVWTVEVSADQVNADGWLQTPAVVDAVFALVVSGVESSIIPSGMSVNVGNHVSGTIGDVERSNNTYLRFSPTISQRAPSLRVTFNGTAPTASLSELRFRIEGSSNMAGNTAEVFLWNYTTNQFDLVATQPVTTTDAVISAVVTNNPSRYVHPTNRSVSAAVSFGFSNLRNWLFSVDQVRWTLAP